MSLAVLVFALMLLVAFFLFNSLMARTGNTVAYTKLEKKAEFVTDAVYNSISDNAVFDNTSTFNFFQQNQTQVDALFDISHNFTIKLTDSAGAVLLLNNASMSVGQDPARDVRNIVTARRIGLLNGTAAKVVMKIW